MRKLLLPLMLFVLILGCTEQSKVCFSNTCVNVELAVTPKERAQGLMHRESLEGGMLFKVDDGRVHKFWMKDTLIALDIVWFKDNGIIFISRNTQPCKKDPCPAYGPELSADYVLEVNAGFANTHNIKKGGKVDIHANI